MAALLAYRDAVDIGGGRGRLAAPAAASLARVDAVFRSAFGRAADINEAWRSPEQADENARKYQAYLAFQRGGPWAPWAPIGLPADESIHCRGFALDTDDTTDEQIRIWNDHGWFWTVYRNGVLVERWHLEYFEDRDHHRHEGTPAGEATKPKEWDEMATEDEVQRASKNAVTEVLTGMLGDKGAFPKVLTQVVATVLNDRGGAFSVLQAKASTTTATSKIKVVSHITGVEAHVTSPYHVSLLQRFKKTAAGEVMLDRELTVVKGYLRAINAELLGITVDADALAAELAKILPTADTSTDAAAVGAAVDAAIKANTTVIAKAVNDDTANRLRS